MSNQNIFDIQETIHVIGAALRNVKPSGFLNGQNIIKIIKFLRDLDNFENFVPVDFTKLIDSELKSVKKDILKMYVLQ